MIPILYAANESTFSHNGIGRLIDCTECVVTEERNGIYECEFSYPITGQYYSEISLDRLVMAKPNEMSDDQLFRIYRISKPIKGIVKIYCQHISYDLITNVCKPFKLLSATALEALQGILNNCYHSHSFTCQSTASGTHEFEIKVPTAARACLGGTEGSLLDTFGGEFEFDNHLIKLHGHRGQDTGVTILYGKNLTDVKSDTNLSNTYNAIFPYAVDEEDDTPVHTLDGNTKIIAISGAATYGEPRTLAVDLTDRFDLAEEDITSAKLQQYANDYLSETDLKSIYQNIEISFVQLWQTEEYKNVALLERVGLCDTVTVRYEKLGIDATAKVIKTVYNVLTEKYEKIELGNVKSNFVDAVRKEAEKKIQQAEEDNRSALQRAIDNATALITGQEGGNVVINTDTNGKPKEILIMNTDNIQTASKVWRWNLGGLGYSNTGYSGSYGVAMTMNGAIVADYITTGTLNASVITAGVLQDAQGKNYWNLNNGNFRLSQYNALNSLTHDGDTQGIYMVPVTGEDYNELRINASYIKSGTIDAGVVNVTNINASNINAGIIRDQTNATAKNYWNLATGEFRLTAGTKVYKDNGTDSGIFYKASGELRINADYIKTGTLNADLIKAGTLESVNEVTSINMSTGKVSINQSTTGQVMELDDNGIRIKYNGSSVMSVNSNAVSYSINGKQVSLRPTYLWFSNGVSSLTLEPNSSYSAYKTSSIELSQNLSVAKTINASNIYSPYSYGNNTFIDFKGVSYQGKPLSPVKITVSGSDYYVLAYPDTIQPVQVNSLNLNTTSILNSPFVSLSVMLDYKPYVIAAYDTTQSGTGTDITTADVSYWGMGFDYEIMTLNAVSYAVLTAAGPKNAATDYDELKNSSGLKFVPMYMSIGGTWCQVFGYKA